MIYKPKGGFKKGEFIASFPKSKIKDAVDVAKTFGGNIVGYKSIYVVV